MTLRRLILAAALALTAGAAAHACTRPANLSAVTAEAAALINAQRGQAGLPALRVSGNLTKAAQDHSCDQAGTRKMGHTGSDGSSLSTRLRRVGYRFRAANENVYSGAGGPADAVRWWMNSAGHKRNILSGSTRDMGIGVARGADNRLYWTFVSGG